MVVLNAVISRSLSVSYVNGPCVLLRMVIDLLKIWKLWIGLTKSKQCNAIGLVNLMVLLFTLMLIV